MTQSRYSAFISYSHADERWAAWLQRRLENFTTRGADMRHPLRPVFRDRSELAAGALTPAIDQALAASGVLIVICSPASAESQWVAAEIERFRALHTTPLILPLVVENADGAYDSVFPQPLRAGFDGGGSVELLAADVRPDKDGKRGAVLKLAAALLDTSYDSLRRRADSARMRRLVGTSIGALAIAATAIALAVVALLARNEADERRTQAEELVTFMIGDVRDELGGIGRLDLMEAVGNEAIAYFETLDPDELTPETLLQRGRALRQIGDVRVDQGDYEEGMRLFSRALVTFDALPENQSASDTPVAEQLAFERALTHLARSGVHYARGDIDSSRADTLRYRDLIRGLVTAYPANRGYVAELATAENNLGALAFAEGELDDAHAHFSQSLDATLELLTANPDDPARLQLAATAEIWLGNIAERRDDLPAAQAEFASAIARQRQALRIDPSPANREALARTLTILSVLTRDEDPYQSVDRASEAVSLMRDLVTHEPDNSSWQQRLNRSVTILVGAQLALGCDPGAPALLADAQARSTRLLAATADSLEDQRDRIDIDVLAARYALGTGAVQDAEARAQAAADRALEVLQRNPRDDLSKRYALRAVDVLVRAQWLQGRAADAEASAALTSELLQPIEDPRSAELHAELTRAASGDWAGWPPEASDVARGCGA